VCVCAFHTSVNAYDFDSIPFDFFSFPAQTFQRFMDAKSWKCIEDRCVYLLCVQHCSFFMKTRTADVQRLKERRWGRQSLIRSISSCDVMYISVMEDLKLAQLSFTLTSGTIHKLCHLFLGARTL